MRRVILWRPAPLQIFQKTGHSCQAGDLTFKGRGFGQVVRAADWHTGDPGSIFGRDGLCTFECIPQRFESASAETLHYIKAFIYLFIYLKANGH
jgi:hypothetical protein